MDIHYFMIRVVSASYYTLEFLIALVVLCIILFFYVKNVDRKSIYVFLIAGGVNSAIELLLQGIGTRVTEGAFFFNLPLEYPSICFILGFYEGGVKTLIAYHFVMFILYRKKINKGFCFGLIAIVIGCFLIYSVLTAQQLRSGLIPEVVTVRNMFALSSIILLIASFATSISYVLFNKKIPRSHKITLLYYVIGVVFYLLSWLIPLHAFSLRYIGILESGTYVPAMLQDQLLLMYGYFLFFEGVGVNILIYPLIYRFTLPRSESAGS